MSKDPYEELGLDKSASRDDVRKAYRKEAKKRHPDHGGDAESFERANAAYVVLYDPATRERYDETGEFDPKSRTQDIALGEAMQLIASLLTQALGAEEDPGTVDFLQILADCVKKDLAQKQGYRVKVERAMARAEKMLKKHLKPKEKSERPGVLVGIVESQIRDMTEAVRRTKEKERVCQIALEIVRSYDFDKDAPSAYQYSQSPDIYAQIAKLSRSTFFP